MGYTRYNIKKQIDTQHGTLFLYEAISDNHGRDKLVGTFVSLGNPNHHDSTTLSSKRSKHMTDQVGFELVREARQQLEQQS